MFDVKLRIPPHRNSFRIVSIRNRTGTKRAYSCKFVLSSKERAPTAKTNYFRASLLFISSQRHAFFFLSSRSYVASSRTKHAFHLSQLDLHSCCLYTNRARRLFLVSNANMQHIMCYGYSTWCAGVMCYVTHAIRVKKPHSIFFIKLTILFHCYKCLKFPTKKTVPLLLIKDWSPTVMKPWNEYDNLEEFNK